MRDHSKNVDLCVIQTEYKKGISLLEDRNSWIKDIKLFRDNC